jgi:hypothetical protein
MKLSFLLDQRQALLRQARLANLAFAFDRLGDFNTRIARARIRGEVRLQQAAPNAERFWASLTAQQGSQAVLDEHFTDEDLMDLADVIAYATGENEIDLTFRIEELGERFLDPLRARLQRAGVILADADKRGESSLESSRPEEPNARPYADEDA